MSSVTSGGSATNKSGTAAGKPADNDKRDLETSSVSSGGSAKSYKQAL
jgi:hypothetical protein